MQVDATKVNLEDILYLRSLFLQENNFQIRNNSRHERGWTDSYMLVCEGRNIGYGSVMGKEEISDRNAIFEFYLVPPYRKLALPAFQSLIDASRATFIECQSNDLFFSSLTYEFAHNIVTTTVLFGEGSTTEMKPENVVFRKISDADKIFEHKVEPVGGYVLECNKEIVATGGFLLHYNKPFADLFMEVREDQRRKGFGSYLIQECKRECYLAGRVPAARTGVDNLGSRATLTKAGLKIYGYILEGEIKRPINKQI